jgi:hypothetical protein
MSGHDMMRGMQQANRRATAAEQERDRARADLALYRAAVAREEAALVARVEALSDRLAQVQARQDSVIEAAVREVHQAAARDLAWHGLELRILRRQLRSLEGVLRGHAGDFLGAEEVELALAHLAHIDEEERRHGEG